MQFSFLKFALISAVISVVNADIVAFSGSSCNGGQGANVPCNGGCIGFQNRHSFRVLSSGSHCVTYFQNTDCTLNVGSNVNSGNGACTNVNTGTNVQSIRCSPNAVCQLARSANSTDAPALPPSESPVSSDITNEVTASLT